MAQCGTMTGGRRRKSKKTRKTRRGGAGYGFNGAIGANGPEWAANSTSTPMNPDGTVNTKFAAADTATNSVVGGRRRKSRKGKSKKAGRRSRKSRGRKMRTLKGGAWSPGNVNAAGVGYGFSGPTSGVTGGIAPASAYPARVGGAPMGADGVRSA